jgi:hypothetical protein
MRWNPRIVLLLSLAALAPGGCGSSSPAAPSPAPVNPSAISNAAEFTVTGVVRESVPGAGPGALVRGVTLEVLTKRGVLTTAVSDAGGSYHVDGVAGTFQLRESKRGYESRTVTVGPVTAAQTVDVTIAPVPRSLSGVVTERPPTQTKPLAGTRVEVVSGANAGAAAATDGTGRYTLPAMWGEFDLRISRDDYLPTIVHVDMSGEDVSGNAQLRPTPRVVTERFENAGSSGVFRLVIPVHNDGEIAITDWAAYGFEEGDGATLQIWEDGRLLAQTFVERSIPRNTVLLRVPAIAGRTYEVRGISMFWWYAAAVSHPN